MKNIDKAPYVEPQIEVLELSIEDCILSQSMGGSVSDFLEEEDRF